MTPLDLQAFTRAICLACVDKVPWGIWAGTYFMPTARAAIDGDAEALAKMPKTWDEACDHWRRNGPTDLDGQPYPEGPSPRRGGWEIETDGCVLIHVGAIDAFVNQSCQLTIGVRDSETALPADLRRVSRYIDAIVDMRGESDDALVYMVVGWDTCPYPPRRLAYSVSGQWTQDFDRVKRMTLDEARAFVERVPNNNEVRHISHFESTMQETRE